MRFYNKYFQSNYEELITYYPRYYRGVLEMEAILKAHGRLADGMEDKVEQAYLNGFIDTADEPTLIKLMEFFGLEVRKSQSVMEKRGLLKMLLRGGGKLSATLLKEMLAAYTDAPIDITFEPFDEEGNNRLIINCKIPDSSTFVLSDVKPIIEQKIPAHLVFMLLESIEWDGEIKHEERIRLLNVALRWQLPFWKIRTLDGSWELDGDEKLDAARNYDLPLGVIFNLGFFVNIHRLNGAWRLDGKKKLNAEGLINTHLSRLELKTAIPLKEKISSGLEVAQGETYFWQNPRLNGEHKLNGEFDLSKQRQADGRRTVEVTGAAAAIPEIITAEWVEIKRNLWYMDGSVTFGEAGKLNAFYEKEAI